MFSSISHEISSVSPAYAALEGSETHKVSVPSQTAASAIKHHEAADDEIMGLFGTYPNSNVAEETAPAGQPTKTILDIIVAEHREIRCVGRGHQIFKSM